MQRIYTLLAHTFAILTNLGMAHAGWECISPIPEPAAGFMAGAVKGKLIIAGGTNWRDDTKHWLDSVWRFDPATNEWSTGPTLPHPVAYAGFASDGNRLYFAGGADGKLARKEVYALDDQFKLFHIADLPQPVVFNAASLADGTLSLFGGTHDPDDWSKGSNQLFRVNLASGDTKTLVELKQFEHALGIPAVIRSKNGLISFTGAWVDGEAEAHNSDIVYRYYTATNTWRALKSYPEAVRGVFGVLLDEHHAYLAGGYGSDTEGFIAKAFLYDLRTDLYTPSKPLPLAINTTLVNCGEFIYLLGGEDKKRHRSAMCFRIHIRELMGKP